MLTALAAARGVPPELRAGTLSRPPPAQDWALLPSGEAVLADGGVRPSDGAAARQFYERRSERRLDLNGSVSGEAGSIKTIVPASCEPRSLRLAAGQADAVADACIACSATPAPAGAGSTGGARSRSAQLHRPGVAGASLALAAFQRVLGRRPALSRSGGTFVPILTALSARGIPTIHTGFDSPDGNAHAPNERLYVPYVGVGVSGRRDAARVRAARAWLSASGGERCGRAARRRQTCRIGDAGRRRSAPRLRAWAAS
jgi:acetylornithine deacetylase/succinyl-diaminopimelate desuccinylase-like protein